MANYSEGIWMEGILIASKWLPDGSAIGFHLALPDEVNLPLKSKKLISEANEHKGAKVQVFGEKIGKVFEFNKIRLASSNTKGEI